MANVLKLNKNKMRVKVLAPAVTEAQFVKRAYNIEEFNYKDENINFHTAKDMSGFLTELYDSEKQ